MLAHDRECPKVRVPTRRECEWADPATSKGRRQRVELCVRRVLGNVVERSALLEQN